MRRGLLPWAALGVVLAVPLVVAATSPLLEWRDPIYIAAGLAGVIALELVLVQPLLAAGVLPGRRWHRWVGLALVLAVVLHVAGLWLTSPPDVVDVLLLRSPTPFSLWGVAAMWAVFASGLLVVLRRRVRAWRSWHKALAVVVAVGGVGHALLIEGTMGVVSKTVLCALVLAALGWTLWRR